MVRPLIAAMESSTKPISLRVSVWMVTCTSMLVGDGEAVVDGGGGGAPVLVQLEAAGAGAQMLLAGPRAGGVALAEEAEVQWHAVRGLQHHLDCCGAGVHVVALVPVAGPVPPPSSVVTPRAISARRSAGGR